MAERFTYVKHRFKHAAQAGILFAVIAVGASDCGGGGSYTLTPAGTSNANATENTTTGSSGNSNASSLPAFPTTSEAAAAFFGDSPSDWESINNGQAWHLKEGSRRIVNPHGYLMEGYFDSPSGTVCGISGDEQKLQGATIWDEAATPADEASLATQMRQPTGGSCTVFPSADFNG